ncbi:MAG: metallophosphoesterase [Haliscomenobacter sp.]|nr:metallophosphoesterase [Haliscomenobacter sp.]MBK8879848.1 metallophosphoesterase [Haliscomenobacter sp.]
MRIQYCSDLHLEFERNNHYVSSNPLQVCGEILILAGDIVPLHDEHMNSPFFRFIAENYAQVYWVPGNHEYYYHDIAGYGSSMHQQIHPKISIVNNVVIEYGGVPFIFSTMWSKISPGNERLIEQQMADFDCITYKNKKLRAPDFNRLHEESVRFLNTAIHGQKRPFVVVTHHLPSPVCNSRIHQISPINEAFCVDLSDLIRESNASFWIYGHSHYNAKPVQIGNTFLLTNQLGYVHLNEHGAFRRNAYLSV